jgi:hypothetical protein
MYLPFRVFGSVLETKWTLNIAPSYRPPPLFLLVREQRRSRIGGSLGFPTLPVKSSVDSLRFEIVFTLETRTKGTMDSGTELAR